MYRTPALRSPWVFRCSHNPSLTAAVLCPPLHRHQHKWTLKHKTDKSGNLMSAVLQSQREHEDEDVGRGHLVSFIHFFCRDPVHPVCRIYNEPWALCDWHSSQTTLLITFLQQNRGQRRNTDWREASSPSCTYIHPFIVHSLSQCCWFCIVVIRLFLCLHLWISAYVHICLLVPLYVSGVVSDISVQTMKLWSHSCHSIHPWPTVASPSSYLCVTKEIKLQI